MLERVKSLEEENKQLSERAEESLLLKLVTESLNEAKTEEFLIGQVLEKISIIKNIPFCACFDIVKGQLEHIDHYVDFADHLPDKFAVKVNSDVLGELKDGPYINIGKENAVELINIPKKFIPYTIALIPFFTRTHPAGLFVFVDNKNSESKFSSMIVLLQNIVNMTEARLDNISLLSELKRMNAALEHNIDRRTQELKISNQKLEKEILERKKVLDALVVSEEKFREIFNNASDAIYLWALKQDGKIEKCLEVNEVACKMTGYSREELLKFTPDRLNDKESKKKIPLVLKNLSRDRNITFRAIHVSKTGDKIPVEVSAHLFKLKNKKVILSITRDISKRLAAESALRESEEKYRLLFSAERDAIVIIDQVTGKIVDTNPAALKLYGYSKSEFLTKSALDLSGDRQISAKNIAKMEQMDNTDIVLQYSKHQKKDGTVFPVEIRAGNFKYSGKIMIYAVFHDITDRVKAEESLRKLSRSVEQSPVSVVITDKNGDIEYVNPKFTQVTGYSPGEAIGKNPRILKSGSKSKDEYKNLWDTIISGAEWRGEFQNKRKNGEVYWENATISPIKSELGEITHFLAVKEDITEQKRLQQQLIQAQKMESIGNLAGGIAHDFNNLLTVINGHAEISLIKLEKDHPAHRDMISILHAGKRAESLTRQLLAFSRKQIYETKIINLNDVIVGLDKLVRRLIGENIQIETNLKSNLPSIKADPGQIEQIMMNLVVNARDAINELGESADKKLISVKTGIEKIDRTGVKKYPEMTTGEKIFITIQDTGAGIDSNLKDKIFEPFFTTKDKGKGTGLGLSTVYGIVKQNQGFIYVFSEKGSGTTFKIYWPISKERKSKEIKIINDRRNLKGSESILFVEDDDSVRGLICGALRELGYQVSEANNGKTALKTFETNNHNIDLLITDLIMPEMNGKELVSNIKKLNKKISILYTSGYTDDHIVTEGELQEGLNFIAKPYSISDIATKIRTILNTSVAS